MNITSFLSDPMDTLLSLLIALPGVLFALSMHEAAHGWVAYRCGDPTARLMGRITLNPLKHIDPVGFFCMLFVGFGWAKPVPVNPNNYRNYRKDDLKVSLAGIVSNLILCIVGFMLLTGMFSLALSGVDEYASYDAFLSEISAQLINEEDVTAIVTVEGEKLFYRVIDGTPVILDMQSLYKFSTGIWVIGNDGYGIKELLIDSSFGFIGRTLYDMVRVFVTINLSLAVFNLIPLPPLDGYHVLNDLMLKRPLFANYKAMRTAQGILFAIIMLGMISPKLDIISIALGFVRTNVLDGLAFLAYKFSALINFI